MKNYSKLFFLFFLFTFFPAKAFSQDLTSGMVLNLSQGDNVDKSQILGLEWIHHYKNQEAPDSNLVPGFGLGIQQQSWGSGDFSRLAFSLSLNQYLDYESGWLGNLEYIGLKWSIYTGLGKTADALDCLFCSDVYEDYSGNEAFLTFGTKTMQVAIRITENQSSYWEEGFDPFGVGGSWEDSYTGIPDPEIIFNWFVF